MLVVVVVVVVVVVGAGAAVVVVVVVVLVIVVGAVACLSGFKCSRFGLLPGFKCWASGVGLLSGFGFFRASSVGLRASFGRRA